MDGSLSFFGKTGDGSLSGKTGGPVLCLVRQGDGSLSGKTRGRFSVL